MLKGIAILKLAEIGECTWADLSGGEENEINKFVIVKFSLMLSL